MIEPNQQISNLENPITEDVETIVLDHDIVLTQRSENSMMEYDEMIDLDKNYSTQPSYNSENSNG